jgi:UDP-N-acetylmuramate dehydrogenase
MKITEHASLQQLNSFGLEATASLFYEAENEADLSQLAEENKLGSNSLLLGGGSNVLLLRQNIPLVVKYTKKGIRVNSETNTEVQLTCSAGEQWDDVVAYAVQHGYWGIENLSLIPGTVGAAPIQNIGAYGQEVCQALHSVHYFDIDRRTGITLSAEECRFGYRNSIFKQELRGKAVITEIVLTLSKIAKPNLSYAPLRSAFSGGSEPPAIGEIRETVIGIRKSKLADPHQLGNAGSFFKNPVVSFEKFEGIKAKYPAVPSFAQEDGIKIPAGWLIESAGWKGKRAGNVGCYEKQALVLVNYGNATGKEIADFAETIRHSVAAQFAITLEFEVNFIH